MATTKKEKTVQEKAEAQIKGNAGVTNSEVPPAVEPVKLKHLSIKLPENIHRKLKAKSALDGESTGNVLKRLINDYIEEVQQ